MKEAWNENILNPFVLSRMSSWMSFLLESTIVNFVLKTTAKLGVGGGEGAWGGGGDKGSMQWGHFEFLRLKQTVFLNEFVVGEYHCKLCY